MRPGKRRELDKANSPIDALIDKIEKCKASTPGQASSTRFAWSNASSGL